MRDIPVPLKIWCCVCNHPVTGIHSRNTPDGRGMHIEVTCHGEADEMLFTDTFINSLSADEYEALRKGRGYAFAAKTTGAPPVKSDGRWNMTSGGGDAFTTKLIAEGGNEDPIRTLAQSPAEKPRDND